MKYIVKENDIDLHIHSYFSNGDSSPLDIADYCVGKFKVISITDCDTMEGYEELDLKHYRNQGLVIIPGVEMCAIYKGEKFDVLAYNINPHLFQILRSVFYKRYPGRMYKHITLRNAKRLTHLLGGKLILTHPYSYKKHNLKGEELVKQVIKYHLVDGIECFHPYHTKEECDTLLSYASKYNLLVGAGSDYTSKGKNIRDDISAKGIGYLDVLDKSISTALKEVKLNHKR